MNPDYGVLDISSDEEPDGNSQQMNLEWLCDQLFQDVDDSDDVVVVREVLNPKQGSKKCLNNYVAAINADEKKVQEEDEDDDDCVVLEGDPDKMVSVEENQEDGSDELVVVGEKGQVACRDYPHPRHLCVKYPFSSTLHKFHCEQCHCYVCDTVAPCNLWGTGMSIVDHCHATDKQEVWKTERKNFKLKRCSSLPVIKMSESTSSLVPSPVPTQIPNQLHHLTRSNTMPNNHDYLRSMPLVTAFRPVPSAPAVPPLPSLPAVRPVPSLPAVRPVPSLPAVRPVPSAPNLGVSNIINPGSGSNRLPQSSISQQSPGGYTKYISQKARSQNAPSLGAQPAGFKKTKTSVTYRPAYHSGYGQPHTSIHSCAPSTPRNQPLRGESTKRDYHTHQWINSGSNMNMGTVHNPLPQQHYVNTLHPSAAYQYVTNQLMTETMGTQHLNQQVTYPSDMSGSLSDISVPWVDDTNSISRQWPLPLQGECAPRPHVSAPWADKTNSRQWDQLSQTVVGSIPNASIPWVDDSNSSQLKQPLQPEALGYQGASNYYPPDEHSGKESSLTPGSDNQTSAVPELENLHFEFEDWLIENQPAPSEPAFFSEQNILSPDDAHMDSVLLYDDEWNPMASIADM